MKTSKDNAIYKLLRVTGFVALFAPALFFAEAMYYSYGGLVIIPTSEYMVAVLSWPISFIAFWLSRRIEVIQWIFSEMRRGVNAHFLLFAFVTASVVTFFVFKLWIAVTLYVQGTSGAVLLAEFTPQLLLIPVAVMCGVWTRGYWANGGAE